SEGDLPGFLRRVGAADLDRTATTMRRLYPGWEIEECEGSTLGDGVYPPKGTVYAASWPGAEVIGDQEVMIDAPSRLPEHLVTASAGRRLILHAMHSVVDWLAFAVWEDGRLVRSLSLCRKAAPAPVVSATGDDEEDVYRLATEDQPTAI